MKKATNQRIKPKKLSIVLLGSKQEKVPKGNKRKLLKLSGRIKTLDFKRCMTVQDVRNILVEGFKEFDLQNVQYLICGQDNILTKLENQELDGDGIIDLAGQGSVYLLQKVSKKYYYFVMC